MEESEKKVNKKSYKGLVAIIIILVLAIIGVAVYFICFDKKENKYSTNSNTTKTTTKVYYNEKKDISIQISNGNTLTTNITIDGEVKKIEKMAHIYDTELYTIYFVQVLPITNTNNGKYFYVVDKNTGNIIMTSLNEEESIYPVETSAGYFLVGEVDSFHEAKIYTMDKKFLGYSKLCGIFDNADGKCSWERELNSNGEAIFINDNKNLNGRIVKFDSKGNKLNVFTPKAYHSSDNKISITILSDDLCVGNFFEDERDGQTVGCEISKSNNTMTIRMDDGSQGGTYVLLENEKIVAISGGYWYNIYNIGKMESTHLFISNTAAGTFISAKAYIEDMNVSTSLYTKTGKYLGEFYKSIIADEEGVYIYNAVDIYNLEDELINKDIEYFDDDTEYVKGLEKLTLTKYDVNGNELGKYKCIKNKCEAV